MNKIALLFIGLIIIINGIAAIYIGYIMNSYSCTINPYASTLGAIGLLLLFAGIGLVYISGIEKYINHE